MMPISIDLVWLDLHQASRNASIAARGARPGVGARLRTGAGSGGACGHAANGGWQGVNLQDSDSLRRIKFMLL
ncbi:MAG: hypothetical protein M0Q43_07710 [Methanothrix sp.]|jgi:hypothetical protein|nr:hypothetical protein [Methanothrix sp.]